MSLAQIGEFSFIIAGLGLTLGATGEFLYPVAVAVSAITTLTTPLADPGLGAASPTSSTASCRGRSRRSSRSTGAGSSACGASPVRRPRAPPSAASSGCWCSTWRCSRAIVIGASVGLERAATFLDDRLGLERVRRALRRSSRRPSRSAVPLARRRGPRGAAARVRDRRDRLPGGDSGRGGSRRRAAASARRDAPARDRAADGSPAAGGDAARARRRLRTTPLRGAAGRPRRRPSGAARPISTVTFARSAGDRRGARRAGPDGRRRRGPARIERRCAGRARPGPRAPAGPG